MPNQNDIRQAITSQIISALESGKVPPWRRPWRLGKNAGGPANVVSKRSYRGLNPILLDMASETHGFTSKWWGTFAQWKSLGGRVMPRPSHISPGKWGTQIVFWSPVTKKIQNDQGDLEDDRFFVLRLYTVFNIDQVEGKNLDHLRAGLTDTGESFAIDYEPAEQALEAAKTGMGISIRYGGGRAFYSLKQDFIQMPPKETFESPDEFYATAFHEMTHATEHPSRLDWSRKNRDRAYALGELIAELGGVYVSRELGVPATDMTNHIAYLANWLLAMKNDPRFIFMASAQASKAADFILSFSRQAEESVEAESELVTA
jgi:antirestriction protein ArdC